MEEKRFYIMDNRTQRFIYNSYNGKNFHRINFNKLINLNDSLEIENMLFNKKQLNKILELESELINNISIISVETLKLFIQLNNRNKELKDINKNLHNVNIVLKSIMKNCERIDETQCKEINQYEKEIDKLKKEKNIIMLLDLKQQYETKIKNLEKENLFLLESIDGHIDDKEKLLKDKEKLLKDKENLSEKIKNEATAQKGSVKISVDEKQHYENIFIRYRTLNSTLLKESDNLIEENNKLKDEIKKLKFDKIKLVEEKDKFKNELKLVINSSMGIVIKNLHSPIDYISNKISDDYCKIKINYNYYVEEITNFKRIKEGVILNRDYKLKYIGNNFTYKLFSENSHYIKTFKFSEVLNVINKCKEKGLIKDSDLIEIELVR